MESKVPEIACEGLENDVFKVVVASVVGSRHRKSGEQRQDTFEVKLNNDSVAISLCDGAGSALYAGMGATAVAHAVTVKLSKIDLPIPSPCSDQREIESAQRLWQKEVELILLSAREIIARISTTVKENASLRPFHTTLVAALVRPIGTVFLHVGDGFAGAVKVPSDGEENDDVWEKPVHASKPSTGEYENETYFVTMDNWKESLRISFAPPSDVIVLMTDGPENFALNASSEGLAGPLWSGIHRHLVKSPADVGAQDLAGTLDSDDAQRLSGDDKTIAWISIKNNASSLS